MRYYIFDANGQLFGNPIGYGKNSTAMGITARFEQKLWAIYDARENKDSKIVYRIKLV